MQVVVASGPGGVKKLSVQLPENATLDHLRGVYKPKLSVHRKAFKIVDPASLLPKSPIQKDAGVVKVRYITLVSGKTLSEQGVKEGHEIVFKDLGPQIGYRTVFLVEYAGPIAFLLLYASRPSFIYGSLGPKTSFSSSQQLFIILFAAHFVKRELETIFVHKFSRPTMPLQSIFKNSLYYWAFAAVIGYPLCHPKFTPPESPMQVKTGAAVMIMNEIMNFAVHLQLSRMRKGDGDQARTFPGGPLFQFVSCPNYFHEVMSWVGFSIGTNLLSSWLFTAVGLAQMTEWSLKKHRGYVKADPAAMKRKKSIIPFVI